MQSKQTLQVAVLTLVALGLLAVMFYTPIWWVSLTAPNYPEESFPDGVRIHFHMNGVFNGCQKQVKTEIVEEEALDCVHEMDTINHYVGMYPIAAGGPVERGFGQFLMAFMGVMLIGFICTKPKLRMTLLGVGFAGIAVWMAATLYGKDGFSLQNAGYVSALVTSLDQDASGETSEPEIVIGGVAGVLKDSLEDSGVEVILPSQVAAAQKSKIKSTGAEKAHLINQLKLTYDIDQVKSDAFSPWDGSAFQVMSWHYAKSLGRYFNNQEEIVPMVKNLELAIHVVFVGILGAMVLVVFGSRKNGGLLYWLLILVPIALPLFFLIDYSAWLWWYGHTLNDMGAFSVKPFMPTVFGDGKVAQFTTHSYPYKGFGLMGLTSLILAVAALIRFKQLKQHD
ncbi:MAG: hypothetical protein KZQ82_09290 [Candidatus Thiodiazotropha sp. (ex Lucinoma annulata)]|nr:hypothetical protein [Candidatus Thiodiazotropha sp. (ex Lucinoma borealis)]MCU7871222.1 hypothetical protein [Candidatus Thiodiazotropha sp. (ex Lucinoma borealis)]MCU7884379.1 hypothetical protein [Candidatus Thiodiazotropha sp. (ex Lucinoma annulata)]MCU7947975.1 hypothetical protein [Candidatus Thiodiazotropha sp. (ex Cardiolucina cf. quadrata)]